MHLHLTCSDTQAEAQVNPADGKAPPACSMETIPWAGMSREGSPTPGPSLEWESWDGGQGTSDLSPGFGPSAQLFHLPSPQ